MLLNTDTSGYIFKNNKNYCYTCYASMCGQTEIEEEQSLEIKKKILCTLSSVKAKAIFRWKRERNRPSIHFTVK